MVGRNLAKNRETPSTSRCFLGNSKNLLALSLFFRADVAVYSVRRDRESLRERTLGGRVTGCLVFNMWSDAPIGSTACVPRGLEIRFLLAREKEARDVRL
jgi:hypothetical protein